MQTYLIFVGSLNSKDPSECCERLGVGFPQIRWLSPGRAVEIALEGQPDENALLDLRDEFSSREIDLFHVPGEFRRKKLLIADMDATIVTGETLDDLAELAGLGEEISKVTAAAMRGELDFEAALKLRVSKLRGLPESMLYRTFESMTLSKGAETLVRVMRSNGATCVLVSGDSLFLPRAWRIYVDFHFIMAIVLLLEMGF